MTKSIVFLFALGLPALAMAGLGDSPAEAKVRFGDPVERKVEVVKPADEAMRYQKDGFDVIIGFYLGKSVYYNFSKSGGKLTPQEIEKLKFENSAGLGWSPNPISCEQEKEVRGDRLAVFTTTPYEFMSVEQAGSPWFFSKSWLELAVDLRKKLEKDMGGAPVR